MLGRRWAWPEHFRGHANDAPEWMGALIGFLFFGGALPPPWINNALRALRPAGRTVTRQHAAFRPAIVSGALGIAVALRIGDHLLSGVGFGPARRSTSAVRALFPGDRSWDARCSDCSGLLHNSSCRLDGFFAR